MDLGDSEIKTAWTIYNDKPLFGTPLEAYTTLDAHTNVMSYNLSNTKGFMEIRIVNTHATNAIKFMLEGSQDKDITHAAFLALAEGNVALYPLAAETVIAALAETTVSSLIVFSWLRLRLWASSAGNQGTVSAYLSR